MSSTRYNLDTPIDSASLGFVRVGFGLLLSWFAYKEYFGGQVINNYINPTFNFKYHWFSWLSTTENQLVYCYLVLGIGGILISVGLLYRLTTLICLFAFMNVFLFESAEYQNHYYFICILLLVFFFLPANRIWSIDNILFGNSASTIPRWNRDILCFLMGCVYFFGGVAKLNHDWFQGYPMSLWLDRLVLLPSLSWISQMQYLAKIMSYSGLVFDLTIPFLLFWKRTRVFAFISVVVFHLLNSQLFSIGVFPWLSILLSTLFFDPSWPRRILGNGREPKIATKGSRLSLLICTSIAFVQIIIPLRYHFYSEDPNWTAAGHRFSWRMKLNSRKGVVNFHVVDAHGNVTKIKPESYLTQRQKYKMSTRPELIRQLAHHIRIEKQKMNQDVKVYAESFLSLNGRPFQRYIDPQVDLSRQPYSDGGYHWILQNKIANPVLDHNPPFHSNIDMHKISAKYRQSQYN